MTTETFFDELALFVRLPEGADQLKKLRDLALARNWNAWPALVWFIRGMKAAWGIKPEEAEKFIAVCCRYCE